MIEFGDQRMPQRFWDKVRVLDSGCWEWTAYCHPQGYAQYINDTAHRTVYKTLIGDIPAGLVIDHTCHPPTCLLSTKCPHRRCVNPAHLAAVTFAENRSRERTANHLRERTECANGHPWSVENTHWRPDGRGRVCRACQSVADQKRAPQKAVYDKQRRARIAATKGR